MKKKEKPFTFRGIKLLAAVCSTYTILFLLNHEKALAALSKSGSVLAKILPIFLTVILLTSLLNFFIQPKKIAAHLGEESGLKGWLWALAAGVVSHGPMYAWYPMFEDMQDHGIKNGLIVTFFASRTIKLPLLPMMIDYFGWQFTLILTFYILIGALVQGYMFTCIEEKSG